MSALGTHILVEFLGCTPEIMNDVPVVEKGMVDAACRAGATVINSTFHHFSPYGVSGVVVIEESHLAIHTWPEYGYAAVDLFTCGDGVDPWKSFDHLKTVFEAKNYSAIETKRGSLNLLERVDFDLSTMREEAQKYQNPEKYKRNVWFTDKDQNQALSLRYTGDVLYDKSSEYQRVRVLETYAYGKALTIDDMVMCTEKDEHHYHEMITHPAILTHGNLKNVLVIGGGDGGTIREIFKHPNIDKVTMVEIDANVVEAAKLHLPTLSQAFSHPKLDLQIDDGIQFVKNAADATWDLIIIDGSDPVGPAEGLFTAEFYQNCMRTLKPNGILITQSESPSFNSRAFVELNSVLKKTFGTDHVFTQLISIPTYPSGTWSMMMGVNGNLNPLKADRSVIEKFVSEQLLHYYTPDIHYAAFALPGYVKRLLNE